MLRSSLPVLAVLAALVLPAPAAADSQSTAAAAAAAATSAAKKVLVAIEQRNGSQTGGTVTLQVIGRSRTRVHVQLTNPSGRPLILAIVRGSDCLDNRQSALASTIPLNAVNSSQVSETIVEVPLSNLTSSNYLVQIRDATTRRQITQACARLAR